MCSSASVLFRRKTAVQCSSGLHFSPMAGVRSLLFDSFELVQPDPPGLNSDGPRLLPPLAGVVLCLRPVSPQPPSCPQGCSAHCFRCRCSFRLCSHEHDDQLSGNRGSHSGSRRRRENPRERATRRCRGGPPAGRGRTSRVPATVEPGLGGGTGRVGGARCSGSFPQANASVPRMRRHTDRRRLEERHPRSEPTAFCPCPRKRTRWSQFWPIT